MIAMFASPRLTYIPILLDLFSPSCCSKTP